MYTWLYLAVGRAFAILNDKEKRAQYDQYGEEVFSGQSSGGGQYSANPFDELSRRHPDFFNVYVQPEDLFNMFFAELAGHGLGADPRVFHFMRKMHTRKEATRTRDSRQESQASPFAIFVQLIPIFLLLLISFVNQLLFPSTRSDR